MPTYKSTWASKKLKSSYLGGRSMILVKNNSTKNVITKAKLWPSLRRKEEMYLEVIPISIGTQLVLERPKTARERRLSIKFRRINLFSSLDSWTTEIMRSLLVLVIVSHSDRAMKFSSETKTMHIQTALVILLRNSITLSIWMTETKNLKFKN